MNDAPEHLRRMTALSLAAVTTHGHTSGRGMTPTYRVWINMRARCQRPSHRSWSHYGGRGIGVCARWQTFENFLADMGERPPGMTLDRINNDGNYEPGNCRWATRGEQARNRSDVRWVEFGGERLCLTDWATRYGMSPRTLDHRLEAGWEMGAALTTPVAARRSKR